MKGGFQRELNNYLLCFACQLASQHGQTTSSPSGNNESGFFSLGVEEKWKEGKR